MRLGFAIAAHLDPDVLLLDEIFAVGDEEFQRQCTGTIEAFLEARQDDPLRVALGRRGAGDLPPRLRAGTGAAPLRRRRRQRPDGIPPVERRVAAPGAGPFETPVRPGHRADDRPGIAWRPAGEWDEEGAWVFEFLRARGLRPDQYMLDVGCGSLAAAARLLPFMEQKPLLGLREERRAVRRRRADRAARAPACGRSAATSS